MFSRHEITLREILFSIGIILTCVAGLIAGNFAILNHFVGINEHYELAREVETENMFNYYHETNIGDAFTYANLKFLDPVSGFDEITGNYSYVYREEERYTQHTRVVTTTDDDGNTHTHTETYWSWDTIDSKCARSSKVDFNGVELNASVIDISSTHYRLDPTKVFTDVSTINDQPFKKIDSHYIYTDTGWLGNDYRYSYYVAETEFSGAAFVSLSEDTIKPAEGDVIIFHNEATVEQVKQSTLKSPVPWIVLLWIGGTLVTGLLVVLFYILENEWLNN